MSNRYNNWDNFNNNFEDFDNFDQFNDFDEYDNNSSRSFDNDCDRDRDRDRDRDNDRDNDCDRDRREQRHVHEFQGSTKLACMDCTIHNHRFAGVTEEAIPRGRSHVHRLRTNTDFFEEHFHEICDTTGPAIYVGNGKHVHFVKGRTTRRDGHTHEYNLATLIEAPTECERRR